MKTIGLGIVIQGAISSSFNSSLKTTNFGILSIDKSIAQLNKTKLQIKEFHKLSKDADENKDKLDSLSNSLKKVGIDTSNLNRDSKLLRLSLINLKKVSKIDIKIQGLKEQFEQQKASILGITAALYGLKKVSNVANDVYKAQGEIRSLEISKKGIDSITKAGHEMSLQFGQITAPQFIRASYDIKSGIASLSEEGVRDFTKMAATTAVATKAQVEDMTKLYALGYGIFRKDFTSDMDFGKKFSGAIAASVQAFRTDGADLASGISNVGAQAKAMGVSLEEELAIIGLSKESFQSASEAGSGYRAFLAGVGKAQKQLGLEFTDINGKMLPMVEVLAKIQDKYGEMDLAEMDELTTAFGSQEAVKIISALLPKIELLNSAQKNISKSMEDGTTKAEQMSLAMDSGYGWEKMSNAVAYSSYVFGKVLIPVIELAASTLGWFAKGVAWVDENVSWFIPVVSSLTFAIIGLVIIFKIATLVKLGFALATNILRKAFLLQMAQNYMSATSFNALSFSQIVPILRTKLLSVWTLILIARQKIGILTTNLYNRSLMLAGVVMGSLATRIKAFALWSKIATASQWLFNIALNANPIGLLITGISLLIGLGVVLYKNFEPVRNLFDSIYEGGKKLLSFIGFGGEEEQDIPNKKNISTNKLATTALTTTPLVANPLSSGEIKPTTSQVVKNESSYNITVNNPSSNVDIERAIKEREKKQQNRQFGDI